MSDYTAFVAVDASRRTAGGHGTTVHQAVPVPEGVRYETTVGEQGSGTRTATRALPSCLRGNRQPHLRRPGVSCPFPGDGVRPTFAVETLMSRVARTAILGGLLLSLSLAAFALILRPPPWHRVNPDYLSVSEVCGRWGERPLDIAEFRSAGEDESVRATMACSLLRNQDDHVGMHHLEIRRSSGTSAAITTPSRTPRT